MFSVVRWSVYAVFATFHAQLPAAVTVSVFTFITSLPIVQSLPLPVAMLFLPPRIFTSSAISTTLSLPALIAPLTAAP